MSDLHDLFSELLVQHNGSSLQSGRRKRSMKDGFMNEAYTIEASIANLTRYLLSIRQAYLSTARRPLHLRPSAQQPNRKYFTDEERDAVDSEAKSMMRQYLQVITTLESVEKQRAETARLARTRNISFKRWFRDLQQGPDASDAEEESSKWLSMHREGVIWLLKNKLERLSKIQREQQETRVMRSVEKSKSALQNSMDGMGGMTAQQAQAAIHASKTAHEQAKDKGKGRRAYLPPEEQEEIEQTLSKEQLQIFAKENQDLLKQYEETLDQVRTAEKSLLEVSELQTQLAANLTIQSTYMDQLYADSILTQENMQAGNKELKKAAERESLARRIFQASVGFCAFLIVMDLVI